MLAYVALKRLRWGKGWIEPGEPVPAGEPGRNYGQMLRLGSIKKVKREAPADHPPSKSISNPKSQSDDLEPLFVTADIEARVVGADVQPAPEPESNDVDWSEEVKLYHKGYGRFDIPGVGIVRGKEAAIEALKNALANE